MRLQPNGQLASPAAGLVVCVPRDLPRASRRWNAAVLLSLALHGSLLVWATGRRPLRPAQPDANPVSVVIVSNLAASTPTAREAVSASPPSPNRSAKGSAAVRRARVALPVPAPVRPTPEPKTVPEEASAPALPSRSAAASAVSGPPRPGDPVAAANHPTAPVAAPMAAPASGSGREAVRVLPPSVGMGQLAIDPDDPRFQPVLPPALRRAGTRFEIRLLLCVGQNGRVESARVLKPSDPMVDQLTTQKVLRTFLFRPYTDGGHPIPFCFPFNYTLSVAD